MTSGNGDIFRVASDAELLYFLWCEPEQTVKQTAEMLAIWNAMVLIVTSL